MRVRLVRWETATAEGSRREQTCLRASCETKRRAIENCNGDNVITRRTRNRKREHKGDTGECPIDA